MFLFVISFLTGDVLLRFFSVLPGTPIIISIMISGGVLLWRCRSDFFYVVIAGILLGFSYTAWYAHQATQWNLPHELEEKEIEVTGHIVSLPVNDHGKFQFEFLTHAARLRLLWNNPSKQLKVGDEWHLVVKLKRMHATQNPGAMDFEAWALQKNIRAKGNVVSSKHQQLISHAWYRFPVLHLRQKLMRELMQVLPKSAAAPWLVGLMMGERNNIPPKAWEVLRNTGTNHLMVVAGLHIGIIVECMHYIFIRLARRLPRLLLHFPGHLCASVMALMIAFYYSVQAGFSVPTQRASLMLFALVLVLIRRRKVVSWHVWSFAQLCVLLINPLVVLSESFWLSFVTIALILYGMRGRLSPSGLWWQWGRVQWVICLGLIPLSLLSFQECSVVSVVANSLAIPWLGFLVLPFCVLAGFVLPFSHLLSEILLSIANVTLSMMWWGLTLLSQLKFSVWHQAISSAWVLLFSSLGMIFLLLPKGILGRWFGLVFLLPLFFPSVAVPARGDYWLSLIDVGQGLSALVRTHQHVLLFDTGAKYADSLDAGEQIIVPYLRYLGVKQLDITVISHGDNDHRGGLDAVRHAFRIKKLLTSVPNELNFKGAEYCIAGMSWQWDGVTFRVLHPAKNNLGFGNDSSCVLLVDNGKHRVLLTADIEAWAEKQMLERDRDHLHADILIAPHHGSKTSSTEEFVRAVHPRYVFYPLGYLNRYHFPHARVTELYNQLQIKQLNTADSGEIEVRLIKNSILSPSSYRLAQNHYWLDK